jgi:hypothetical protein
MVLFEERSVRYMYISLVQNLKFEPTEMRKYTIYEVQENLYLGKHRKSHVIGKMYSLN